MIKRESDGSGDYCVRYRRNQMVEWKNLNELSAFQELEASARVCLPEVMSGENGAQRAKTYCAPMAEGMVYNYAAKAVDETVLEGLKKLA
ncbi:MAG: hypothetical protein II004_00665, partial [Erysipelotrichaceae bacterium]|nr:hypothetical protein [Erysipelotrichaceae bacterium]